jgi:hypothetical protein
MDEMPIRTELPHDPAAAMRRRDTLHGRIQRRRHRQIILLLSALLAVSAATAVAAIYIAISIQL